MRWMLAMALLALAACGADGEPEPPEPKDRGAGLTVSGEARFGIVREW
ncbi:MAG: argininosuccinate lyase [Rhodosalinus sp.]